MTHLSSCLPRRAAALRLFIFGLLACTFCLSGRAAEAKKNFALPAGDARETLKTFARQAGREIVFSVETVEATITKAVKGELAPREALDAMLAGTGLVATQDAKSGAFAVRRITAAPPATIPPRAPPAEPAPKSSRSATQETTLDLDPYSVTVTVQKRPQSAQEVPIAMTSLAYHTLDRFKIESLRDLSRFAPNVLVSAFNQTSPTIAIRGATNTFSQIGVNKPVAVVIDDVFVPRNSAASFELFDLDSVQILRGPQGTLFGRNVTGGAIVLNTRQPSLGERAASVSLETGNYNRLKYQGMVNLPLAERAAASVTVARHTHDGYGRDRLTGRDQDDLDSTSLRGQLLMKPKPGVSVLLRADYSDDRNGGRTLSSKGVGDDGDRRTSELAYDQDFERTIWGASGRVDWQTSLGDFSSITAYRESEAREAYSGTGVSYAFLTGGSQSTNRDRDNPGTFTQELRFASPKWAAGDFVSGLYFLQEDAYRNLKIEAYAARTGAAVTQQTIAQTVTTDSLAGYADGTWRLTPALSLTAGLRYTTDRKEAALTRVDARVPANGFTVSGLATRWSELTPRAVLAWRPDDRLNVYASATRGFTSGGYNTEAATAAIAAVPFAPETVTNYELGVKTQLWEKRLRANVALFQAKYADKQELYFNTLTRILTIVNASEATMKGAEIELLFTPTPSLALSAAYGHLDTEYDEFVIPGVLNNTGNPLGSAPRNKFSLGADWQRPLRGWGTLSFTAAYSWTDDYYTGATKDPNLSVPAYALTNASLRFDTADGHWRVSVWGRNLVDTDYLLTPSTQGVLAEYLGEPRTYGVTLTWRY